MAGLIQAELPTHSDMPHIREQLRRGYSLDQAELINAALDWALEASAKDTRRRPRGIDVAIILQRLKADVSTLLAALLSDPYLRENLPAKDIHARFGETVANLVQKVNWLNTFTDYRESAVMEPEQAELLRRMLLAVVNDVRAVLIKLAYRLERLRMLSSEDYETRRAIAQETMDIFVPLANRLGVAQIKWELEDLAFRYLAPMEYGDLARQLAETRAARESYVACFTEELSQYLLQEKLNAKVYGRPKHIHSIWKKMERKHAPLEELYDLRAVRVLVDSISDCYTVLGLVHNRWRHIAKEFDDYIANPKPNGYKSLHTVVIGPEGKSVEIQIRTREMHAFAEYGVAAHWRYKEGGNERDEALERSIALLRGLLETPGDDHTLLKNFRLETEGSDVFVLSPKGRVIRLEKGATPLDFAYAIHSEVGNRCRGAKVNGRMVPLTYSLVSGERVEILTSSQASPSRHWLEPAAGFLHSRDARAKVRQWFKQQSYEQDWRQGKTILDREKQKLGLREIDAKPLLERYSFKRWEDFLAAVGRGEISQAQLSAQLAPDMASGAARPFSLPKPVPASGRVCIPGIPNLTPHLAGCCKPQPNDPIVSYISVTKGLTVHRRDCGNISRLGESQRRRLLDAYWEGMDSSGEMEIRITATDRRGLLKDITQAISNERLNIVRALSYKTAEEGRVALQIVVERSNTPTINSTLTRIRKVEGVVAAQCQDTVG